MELIIKIPDKVYNRIKSDNGHGYCTLRDQDEHVIVNAICNSIRLAKGHGDLIDRSEVTKKGVCTYRWWSTGEDENAYPAEWVDDAEVVIPADKENDDEKEN